MQVLPIIDHTFFDCSHLWKLIFFVLRTTRWIQCQIHVPVNISSSAINAIPSLSYRSSENLPLTEQIIYDLRNDMRKASVNNDFDDDDDYSEDEDIELKNDNHPNIQLITLSPTARSTLINSIMSTSLTSTSTTINTTNINTQRIESKSSTAFSSSSVRLLPSFVFLSSLLYNSIHVKNFLF